MSSFSAYSLTSLSASQTVSNFETVRSGHILPKGGAALAETSAAHYIGTSTYRWNKLYANEMQGSPTLIFSSKVTFDAQATFTGSVSVSIPAIPSMICCKYITPAGANPQVGSSTAEIVQFNTATLNTIDGATLSTNQVELPTGAYMFKAYVQAWISGDSPQSSFYLFNATSSLTVFECGGPHSRSTSITTTAQIQESEMHMTGYFSLATTSSLEMRVAHADARTIYFGPNPVFTTTATFNDGLKNVYQQIVFFKVS